MKKGDAVVMVSRGGKTAELLPIIEVCNKKEVILIGVTENLKVLPAGMVPPNPAELLASPRLEKAIEALKEKFDYVLLDTAPVALVTDTLIAGRVADLSVYVCRSEVTHKSDFELVNEIRKERKLPHMALVVNAVNLESKRYGYGYGYGKYGKYGRYGKKYGYGYGETKK